MPRDGVDFRQRAIGEADEQNRLPGAATRRSARCYRGATRATASGVRAVVFVGDAMEERVDDLCAKAGELGLLKVPVFMFRRAMTSSPEQAFPGNRAPDRGAWCQVRSRRRGRNCASFCARGGLCAGGRSGAAGDVETGSGAAKLLAR